MHYLEGTKRTLTRQDFGNLMNQLNGRQQQQHRGSEAERL